MSTASTTAPPAHLAALLKVLDPVSTAKDFTRAAAFYFPNGEWTEDAAKHVYLDDLLGKERVEKFGDEETYLTEWKEIVKGPPPADSDKSAYTYCMKNGDFQAELGFEMLFDNTDLTAEVKAAVAEAFDGDSRATWEEWAAYKLGNGDVEHGAMFAAKGKDGSCVYIAYFGE